MKNINSKDFKATGKDPHGKINKKTFYEIFKITKVCLRPFKFLYVGLIVQGVVHVVLVQARSVKAMDHGNSSDPYCKVLHFVFYSFEFV